MSWARECELHHRANEPLQLVQQRVHPCSQTALSHTRLLHHALCVHTTNRTQFDCRKDCLCPARIAPSWPSHRPSRALVLVCHDASHHRSSDACARACACGSVGVQMLLHRCIPLSNKWKARCDRSQRNSHTQPLLHPSSPRHRDADQRPEEARVPRL